MQVLQYYVDKGKIARTVVINCYVNDSEGADMIPQLNEVRELTYRAIYPQKIQEQSKRLKKFRG